MAIVLEMPEMSGQEVFPQSALTDLNIDGDHAKGKAGDKQLRFLRENGRWYLTADVME